MSQQPDSLAHKAWRRIADVLQVKELVQLLGAGSMATAGAAVTHAIHAGALVQVFATVTAFAAGGLVAPVVGRGIDKLRYRWDPPNTTVEVYGGTAVTIAVRHTGLPVKARVRIQFQQLADAVLQHPEPFDLLLQPKAYGAGYRSVDLSNDTDMAKATLVSVEEGRAYTTIVRIYLPGTDIPAFEVNRREQVLLSFDAILFATSPLGAVLRERRYDATIHDNAIRIEALGS